MSVYEVTTQLDEFSNGMLYTVVHIMAKTLPSHSCQHSYASIRSGLLILLFNAYKVPRGTVPQYLKELVVSYHPGLQNIQCLQEEGENKRFYFYFSDLVVFVFGKHFSLLKIIQSTIKN